MAYYRSLFKRYLEGKTLSEELVEYVVNHENKWLRNVFRHYVQYLYYLLDRGEDVSKKIADLLARSITSILKHSKKRDNVLVVHYSGKEISRVEEEAIAINAHALDVRSEGLLYMGVQLPARVLDVVERDKRVFPRGMSLKYYPLVVESARGYILNSMFFTNRSLC
jgi:hypothetical protein